MMRSRSMRYGMASLLLAAACASPTLPLPPPSGEASAATEAGLVHVEGTANERAFVGCLNLRTERGVLVRADDGGHFELTLEGQAGDDLQMWQIVGADSGQHVIITVAGDP